MIDDVERLWEEHNSLKTAVTTLETSLSNISNDLQELSNMFGSFKEEYNKGFETHEKKWDDKLQTFVRLAADDCTQNILKCKTEWKNEIEKVRKQNVQQEARFQSITDTLRNQIKDTSPINSATDPQPKWSHIETIRNDCSSRLNDADNEIASLKEKLGTMNASNGNSDMSIKMESLHTKVDTIINALKLPTPGNDAKESTVPGAKNASSNSKDGGNASQQHENRVQMTTNMDTTSSNLAGTSHPRIAEKLNLVVWTDSNGKTLDPQKFWKTEGSLFERTYTILDVNKKLDALSGFDVGCMVVNCGVNDIEDHSGAEVAQGIIDTIKRIRQEHPTTKII